MRKLTRSKGKAYTELTETLKRQIKTGELARGERILAERKLADMFKISRESVRRGMQVLAEEGFLKIINGQGTFVDYQAKPPRTRKTRTATLGYIFWGSSESILSTPFFADIINGVQQECQNQGFHLMVAGHEDLPQLPAMVLNHKVDGVLLEGGSLDAYQRLEQNLPTIMLSNFVHINGSEPDRCGDMVTVDNPKAMLMLFSHLYNLGHRKIAFVSPPLSHSAFSERYEGYQYAHQKFSLPYQEKYALITEEYPKPEAMRPLFEQPEPPTAIMAVNDWTALRVLECAESLGIRVPEQLSVTGFDDVRGLETNRPALTTVRVAPREMGRLAVRRLLEKIDRPDLNESWTLMPGKIIQRESCAIPCR